MFVYRSNVWISGTPHSVVGKYNLLLVEEYILKINCFQTFKNEYVELSHDKLILKKGYAWDGATCFPDIPSIIRASCVHDAFYQVIRESNLPKVEKKALKKYADILFKNICIEDGMNKILASSVYATVKIMGSFVGKLN